MEDTAILRKQLLRTRVVVFILIVFSITCLVYGRVQRIEAGKQRELMVQQMEVAEQAMAEAQRQAEFAMQSRVEADRQRMLAERNGALAESNQKKSK